MIIIDIKPNFSLCVDLATKLLARQNLTSTKIDIMQLEYDKNIYFDSIQHYASVTNTPIENFINPVNQLLSEGCTIPMYEDNLFLVLYNDKIQSKARLNWTLAHEIGHIYCGHRKDSKIEEIEAHFFAAQLLMPEYTLYEMQKCGKVCTETICNLFNVSFTAANKRIDTLNRKTMVNSNESDKKIWYMMKPYIENYYKLAN